MIDICESKVVLKVSHLLLIICDPFPTLNV